MARSRIEDRGLDALKRAANDPIGSFVMRIIGPGVRREISRARTHVERFVDDITHSIKSVEGEDVDEGKQTVIDAEIVDDGRK